MERDPGKIVSTKLKPMFHATDLKKLYKELKDDLITKFLSIQLKGSGWELESILKLQVFIYNFTPFSSYKNNDGNVNISENDRGEAPNFDIGKFWRDKKGLIVPQNKNDPKCFLYPCGTAKFEPANNPGRITKRLLEDIKKFNTTRVNLPPSKDDIRKFEELNNLRIHCICAQTDGKHVEIYKSAYNPHFILMLMKNPAGVSHWCVIPSTKLLSRLISSNISKANMACYICTNCHQNTFRTEGALKKHEKYCLEHEAQKTKLPSKKDYVMFQNERKKIRPANHSIC